MNVKINTPGIWFGEVSGCMGSEKGECVFICMYGFLEMFLNSNWVSLKALDFSIPISNIQSYTQYMAVCALCSAIKITVMRYTTATKRYGGTHLQYKT